MSHYTVLVALDPNGSAGRNPRGLHGALDAALEPFDENLEIEPWDEPIDPAELHYSVAYALENGILTIPEGIAPVERPSGPERSEEELRAHYAYIESIVARLEPETQAEALNHGNSANSWPAKVIDGRLLRTTTRNPDGYWDWWSLGGRWTGVLTDQEPSAETDNSPVHDPGDASRDTIRRGDLDLAAREAAGTLPVTAALLDLDGRWHQPARVGWFGSTFDETMDEATWRSTWRSMVEALPPDTILALVDCHT